jgi:hypothetical protein
MLDKILTVGAFVVLSVVLLVASCMKVDNYFVKKGPR